MALNQPFPQTRIVTYAGGGAGNEGQDIFVRIQVAQGQTLELVFDHVLMNQLIHELPNLSEMAYRQRKEADSSYDEEGTIQESFVFPVKGHMLSPQVDGEGVILRLIHQDGINTDYHMNGEALQKLAHDILDMAQSKQPPG